MPGFNWNSTHVTTLKEFEKLYSNCKSILPAIESISGKIANIITKELENRAIGAGIITRNGLRVTLIDCLAESVLYVLVHQPGNQPSFAQNINCLPDEQQQTRFLSDLNLTISETYQFPQGSPKSIWKH